MAQDEKNDKNNDDPKNPGAVDKIRGLLFGEQMAAYDQRFFDLKADIDRENQKTLDELNTRLDPKHRIRDTAAILPDSIIVAAETGDRLAESMNEPMEGCIRSLIRKDPDQFADALFPVMGPAIRKSINETLKTFLQSMNQIIEQSLSPESLRWRLEAKRCGVPFSEIVLKQTLIYRIDEVFLIQPGSGLVIDYVSHPNVKPRDSDAISAMLTAIKDFSQDSFSGEAGETLNTVEFGERILWIFEGPKALLACVILGVAPASARENFQVTLEQIHKEFADELANFDGDRSKLGSISNLLQNCLHEQAKEDRQSAQNQGLFSKPLTYVILALLLGAFYLIAQFASERMRVGELTDELNRTPGIVIFDAYHRDGKLVINGMVDPVVLPLNKTTEKHGFQPEDVEFNLSLYQSLEPELAIQRARKLLGAPDSVIFSVQANRLYATGTAPQEWIVQAKSLTARIQGFDEIDLSGIELDSVSRLKQIRNILQPPDSVLLELDRDVLKISGTAPTRWIRQLQTAKASLYNVSRFNIGGLVADEWLKAAKIVAIRNETILYFTNATEIDSKSLPVIKNLRSDLVELRHLAGILGTKVHLKLVGYTDGTGEIASNDALALDRANTIRALLFGNGLPSSAFHTTGIKKASIDGLIVPTKRRVEIEISMAKSNIRFK